MTKDLLKQGLAAIFGLFACLLLVAALYAVEDITKLKMSPRPSVYWPSVAAALALAAGAVASFALGKRGNATAGVQAISSRDEYMAAVLARAIDAKRSILLCVHTLKPAESDPDVEKLQTLLREKASVLSDLRVLAPIGEERLAASFQLSGLGVSIRHLAALDHVDMSFSVFDDELVVLPTKADQADATVSGLSVSSTKLAELLRDLFNELWFRADSLPFADFARFTVNACRDISPNLSLAALSQRLGLSEAAIHGCAPTYSLDRQAANVLFVVGRPGAGKSTVVRSLFRILAARGVPSEFIFQFNDYTALYERFRSDHPRRVFSSGERGSFKVVDFSILDDVLREANQRVRLALRNYRLCVVEFARPSYRRELALFDNTILARSRVLHVTAALTTCERRNNSRGVVGSSAYSGFVPPEILRSYYATEDHRGG